MILLRLLFTSALATGVMLLAGCHLPASTQPASIPGNINADTSASIPTRPGDSVDTASLPHAGDTTKAEAGKPSNEVHQSTGKTLLKWYESYVAIVLSVGLAIIGLVLFSAH
jgi:hypothetical protein